MIKLLQGDCLSESEKIPDGSVDLVLIDPPYGVLNTDAQGKDKTDCNLKKYMVNPWDIAIPPDKLFPVINRILRKSGRAVLFSQEPYTSTLIRGTIPMLPFNYRACWFKEHFANALGVNKQMVSVFEDVLIFTKQNPKHDFEGFHPLRPYFESVHRFIGLPKKTIVSTVGQCVDHCMRFSTSQFSLCTQIAYDRLRFFYDIDDMPGFLEYEILKPINEEYKTYLISKMVDANPVTFNLWEGKAYKSNVLNYKKPGEGLHPTQKPVPLLEDLIKTFSNPGDTVADLTMGSGSTGVACQNTGRSFIGIEMDPGFYATAFERIYGF